MKAVANNFVIFNDVKKAALVWYGKLDRDSLCLAEVRLMNGEKYE